MLGLLCISEVIYFRVKKNAILCLELRICFTSKQEK